MKEKTIKSPLLIDTIQRYLLFIIGLFFSALGVAITKKGELGVSPISSVANVMSIRPVSYTHLTLPTNSRV